MSISVWSDLNSKVDIVKLHEMGQITEGNCQKQCLFTSRQFCCEGAGYLNILQNVFEGSKEAGDDILKPAVNVAAPFIGAKSKNLALAQATTNILISRP